MERDKVHPLKRTPLDIPWGIGTQSDAFEPSFERHPILYHLDLGFHVDLIGSELYVRIAELMKDMELFRSNSRLVIWVGDKRQNRVECKYALWKLPAASCN